MRKPTDNWVTQTAAQHGYPATDYSWHISRFNLTPRLNVVAPQAGKVTGAGISDPARGKWVNFQVGNVTYEFSHFQDIGVNVGKTYPEGTLIGIMGKTGQTNGGVHLHLVIKVKGVRVPDPDAWLNAKIAASQTKTVTVTSAANARIAPKLNATITSVLKKGDKFQSVGLVTGDSVAGNNKWHRSVGNKYIWSGNTNVK